MRKIICLTVALLIGVVGFAQKIPARPNPPRLVNDFANILTDKQERALEHKLVAYNDSTSTQICQGNLTHHHVLGDPHPFVQHGYEPLPDLLFGGQPDALFPERVPNHIAVNHILQRYEDF